MSGSGPNKNTVEVVTFGCRLNAFESEVMRRRAGEAGLGRSSNGAIIVNTCAVTGEAVRQAGQAIRRARRQNPDAQIIVSGCAAQTEPERFASMKEVDLVLGNREKMTAEAYRVSGQSAGADNEKSRVGDIMAETRLSAENIGAFQGRARAFVQVQNGCDHRCTFCIIPYGRGNSRSLPVAEVIEQARGFVDSGYREIVLTGVDTTSWGQDLPGQPRLGRLVAEVLANVPELRRLRLSSIDSIEVDEKLVEVIAGEPRFMPHLHLSLQHGDDMILKRMKRRHSRADSIRFCERIRSLRPDMTFGADLIAGFPTETPAMFDNTLDLVEACGLTQLHVFPFSPRPMTPAARMPQLDREIVKERAAKLRELGERRLGEHLDALAGSSAEVLIERGASGRSPDNTSVQLTGAAAGNARCGDIVKARITSHDGRRAFAEAVAPVRSRTRMAAQPV